MINVLVLEISPYDFLCSSEITQKSELDNLLTGQSMVSRSYQKFTRRFSTQFVALLLRCDLE